MNNKLPKIALGAWAWGNDNTFGNTLSKEELQPIFDTAMDLGLNLWDTAFVYGMGTSEKILGEFVKEVDRDSCIISTKFTPQCADESSENPVTSMLKNSEKLLNTDYIDIFWIHNPVGAPKWSEKLVETANENNIRMLGVSNHNLDEIKEGESILEDGGLKLEAVQNHYSLLNRSSENSGILDYCKTNNITFFAYMVLEQGALTGTYTRNNPFPEGSQRAEVYNPVIGEIEKLNESLKEIADNHDVKTAQIPIAWAVNKGTLPIIGATKIHHVEDAYEASEIKLEKDEIKQIEELGEKANINTIREWEKEMK